MRKAVVGTFFPDLAVAPRLPAGERAVRHSGSHSRASATSSKGTSWQAESIDGKPVADPAR